MMTRVCLLSYNLRIVKGISLCLLLVCGCFSTAQVLQPLGNGVPGKVVASYASGNDYLALYEDESSSLDLDYSLAKWNGLYWEYLAGLNTPTEVQSSGGTYNFNSIAIYKDEIYVGAYINNATDLPSSVNHLYKWNGVNWINVPDAVSSTNYGIYDMTVWDGKLIVAGKFLDTLSSSFEVDNIAAYDGTDWVQLGSNNNAQGTDGIIKSLFPAGNRLYVAGAFNTFGGTVTGNIAFYTDNNGNWGGIGSPFSNEVVDLAQVGNTLWAMDESAVTGNRSIRSFKNSKWAEPLSFLPYNLAIPKTIAGGLDELYIGGDFDLVSNIHNITIYKDGDYSLTKNRIEGSFELDQNGQDAYIWGDFKEKSTDISFFSPIVSKAGNGSGTIYYDANNNCVRDLGEQVLPDVTLLFTDVNGEQKFVYSNEDGIYSATLTPGVHSLNIAAGKNWSKLCPASSYIGIQAGEYSLSDIGLNIQPNLTDASLKARVSTINKITAGDRTHVSVRVYNSGSKTINGSVVEITHDSKLSNFSSEPQASNYAGNKATYTILDLKPRQSMLIDAYLNIPLDATETSTYPVSVSMGSLLNESDADLEDNRDEVEAGPMDGNEGKVFKSAITGDTSSMTDDIIGYNIQCVNATGGLVKRVVFIDTLDADYKLMDANLTYFSHPHVKRWSVGRVLVVEIPDANLADREAIPSKSTASIEFELVLSKNSKGKVLMPHGTVLTNRATVDFDNKNFVYTSNMTRVLVHDENTAQRIVRSLEVKVYPNPSSGMVYLESNSGQDLGMLEVYRLNGQKVFTQEANTSRTSMDLSHLPGTSYLLKSNLGTQIIQLKH